jgi:uncharacterized protein
MIRLSDLGSHPLISPLTLEKIMRNAMYWIVLLMPPAVFGQNPSGGRLIHVLGEAEVRVAPDEIVMTLGIETNDKDLSKAKALNDERARALISAITAAGVEPNLLKTDYLDIEPRYEWSARVENFIGYFVRKTFVVTIRDVSRFEEILSASLSTGANYVLGVQFLTSELRKHRDTARALAIRAAREKAVALAAELNQSVGEAQTITEQDSRWFYGSGRSWWGNRSQMQFQNAVQNVGGEAATADGTMAPGQISVHASLRVSFLLK